MDRDDDIGLRTVGNERRVSFYLEVIREKCKIINCLRDAFLKFSLVALTVLPLVSMAVQPEVRAFDQNGIDRSSPNFVTASLLVMSPGNELYSCAGHSCIRLECPTFKLDYCFSYESESVKDKILTFFTGKLRMGMFAIPTADWLKMYEEVGRGVTQYRLNLPPDVKQRLWKLLDEKVAEGPYLPYEYLERGCAQADMVVLREALKPYQMQVLSWPAQFSQTRRELVDGFTASHPWNRFFLHAICGTELDRDVPNMQKIVVPNDLLELLRLAKVNGRPIVDSEGVELLPVKNGETSDTPVSDSVGTVVAFFTPFVSSWVVVGLAAVNCFLKWAWADWAFLAFQSLCGLFFTYLVAFSNLPATSWNWLIVPFNLLPLMFWKWRRKWALWFAGALALWEAGMAFYPHRLTDPAYLVLVGAYILFYLKFTRYGSLARVAAAMKDT